MRLISYFLFISVALTGCRSYRDSLFKTGGTYEVVENGITIFENESKIAKRPNQEWIANIYSIKLDTIHSADSGVDYKLSFMPFDEPWYIYPWTVEGSDAIYSDFIIRGNRAYIWNNPEKKVTEDLLEVHRKYGALDDGWFEEEYGELVAKYPEVNWAEKGLYAPYSINESIPCEEIIISGTDISQYKRHYIPGWEVSLLKKMWIRIKRLFRK